MLSRPRSRARGGRIGFTAFQEQDWLTVCELEDEKARRGNFQLLHPTPESLELFSACAERKHAGFGGAPSTAESHADRVLAIWTQQRVASASASCSSNLDTARQMYIPHHVQEGLGAVSKQEASAVLAKAAEANAWRRNQGRRSLRGRS